MGLITALKSVKSITSVRVKAVLSYSILFAKDEATDLKSKQGTSNIAKTFLSSAKYYPEIFDTFFYKMGNSRPLFFLFIFLIQSTVNSVQYINDWI